MSYTELIIFENQLPVDTVEFDNSWGGAARIWDALFNKYVEKKHEYDSWRLNSNRLWSLYKDDRLEDFEKSVMLFTCDLVYVSSENLETFSNDLKLFEKNYPVTGINHLPAWSKWIDENKQVEAIALYATSCSQNVWFKYLECPTCEHKITELVKVPLSDGHEVYDILKSLNKK